MNNQIIYGHHVVENILLKKPSLIDCIYVTKINTKTNYIVKIANKLNIKCILIKNIKTKNIYNFKKNEYVICKIKNNLNLDIEELNNLIKRNNNNIILILDKIQDTNNLAACIRTAEAANITCIIIIKKKSAYVNPDVIKISCGAALFIPIIETANILKTIQILKKYKFKILASSSKAQKNLYQIKIEQNIAIILGKESCGINEKVKEKCDITFKIPTAGSCGSLNISVANGIILFEILRQLNYKSKLATDKE